MPHLTQYLEDYSNDDALTPRTAPQLPFWGSKQGDESILSSPPLDPSRGHEDALS